MRNLYLAEMNPREITKIGEALCKCNDACHGIKREQSSGIFPRGLIFEAGRPSELGTVVCGQNPGYAKENERDFMQKSDGSYAAVLQYWQQKQINENAYFLRPRRLIRDLGRQGPIILTDLVKCENKSKDEHLSFNHHSATFRHCTNKFLLREINLVPRNWMIVCLGRESYRAITFMFPKRPTLGLPHPSGSYGRFTPFFRDGVLAKPFKNCILKFFKTNPEGTLWLDPREHLKPRNRGSR